MADENSNDPRVQGVRAVVDAIASDPPLTAAALQTVGEKGSGRTDSRSSSIEGQMPMSIAGPLTARARSEQDVGDVVAWISDVAALYLFSGNRLTWPLTALELSRMTSVGGMTPLVVVSSSGDLVGHFDLTLNGSTARLGRVIVKPSLRGRGLAIDVVGLALEEAQRLGADVVRLNVISTNEPAIRTYRRAGFATVEGASDRANVTTMERRLKDLKPRADNSAR